LDVVTVDAWYATGPFVKAVRRLGWGVVSVLKQERHEIYQEATALTRTRPHNLTGGGIAPCNCGKPGTSLSPARVVLAQEQWQQVRRVGGRKIVKDKQSAWRWLVSRELDGYPAQAIWQIGHQRWGVENHAFNELTAHDHLEDCPHHEPVAILAWLLILVLGFVLFEWFARLHGKLGRLGRTLQEIGRQLFLALAALGGTGAVVERLSGPAPWGRFWKNVL